MPVFALPFLDRIYYEFLFADNTPRIVFAVGCTPRGNDFLTRSLLPDVGDESIFHLPHIGCIAGQFRAQRAFLEHCPPRK
jgi:hypothetical protein